MQKHFFAYRKYQNGRATPIQIEVIVSAEVSRQDAQRIADEEVAALRSGHQVQAHQALRGQIARMEQSVTAFPDYRFTGVN